MKFESLKSLRLQGFAKFIHKLFLSVTYPIRHGFKFLILMFVVIAIFVAIPMTQGVSYKHVVDWYLLRYDETIVRKNKKPKTIPEPAERKLKNQYKKEFKFKETAAPDARYVSDAVKRKMEAHNTKKVEKIKRKTFKLNSTPFKHANVKNTWNRKGDETTVDNTINKIEENPIIEKENLEEIVTAEEVTLQNAIQIVPDPIVEDKNEVVVEMPAIEQKASYRKLDSLPLVYEEEPIKLSGKVIVYSANEISVNNNYIILYGIYTNPSKHDLYDAHEYLKELIGKNQIDCDIVAYTHQNYATAMCYLDGKSINHNLVDAGFADNIAL